MTQNHKSNTPQNVIMNTTCGTNIRRDENISDRSDTDCKRNNTSDLTSNYCIETRIHSDGTESNSKYITVNTISKNTREESDTDIGYTSSTTSESIASAYNRRCQYTV